MLGRDLKLSSEAYPLNHSVLGFIPTLLRVWTVFNLIVWRKIIYPGALTISSALGSICLMAGLLSPLLGCLALGLESCVGLLSN